MATANVILAISSKMGPGGLASLKAGVDMVLAMGKAMIDAAKEADRYSTIYKNLSVSITQAETATKGLIDTTEMMANANKFAQANLKLTEQQLADVAKVAVDYAKATGKDATESMKMFTDSLIMGTSRGLQKFGIEVKESTDKSKVFKEALEQVEERAKGISVELENTTEKMFALQNQIGTATGNLTHFYNTATKGEGVLDLLIDSIGGVNDGFEDMFDLTKDLGQEFIELGSLAVGAFTEIQIAVLRIAGFGNKSMTELYNKQADDIEAKANARLKRMRQNERAFRGKTGRGSVAVGGGREEVPTGPGGGGLGRGRGKGGKGAGGPTSFELPGEPVVTEETGPSFFIQSPEEAAELSEKAKERRILEIQEKREQLQHEQLMQEITMELLELREIGADIAEETGLMDQIIAESDPEVQAELIELQQIKIDQKQADHEEDLEYHRAKTDLLKKQFRSGAMGAKLMTQQMNILGNASMQFFDSFLAGTTMSGKAFLKMIGQMAAKEAVYWAIQAAIKTAIGLYNMISPYGDKQEGVVALTTAAGFAASAAALGVFAGAMGAAAGGLRGSAGGESAGGAAGASAGGGVGAGGSSFVGAPGETRDREVNITITLEGGAEGLFNAVREEDSKRRIFGQPALGER